MNNTIYNNPNSGTDPFAFNTMKCSAARFICASLILICLSLAPLAHGSAKTGKGSKLASQPTKSAFDKIQMTAFDRIPSSGTYEFQNVDFGQGNQVSGFIANVRAIYLPTGWIDIRLDSPSGKQIGKCLISQRDGGTDWYIAQAGIYDVEGVHSVYLALLGANGTFSPVIEWFSFTKRDSHSKLLLGSTPLPPQTPYLGPLEKNFFGNGIAGAGGSPDGVWDYLIGPAYSSVSYVEEEKVSISLDGKEYSLGKDLKRVRGTGAFASVTNIGGITVHLIDFALQGTPLVIRAVFVKNETANPHVCVIKASIKPAVARDSGGSAVNTKPTIIEKVGLRMIQEGDMGVTIAASEPQSLTEISDGRYSMRTKGATIEPGKTYQTGFYHYAHRTKDDSKGIIEQIHAHDVSTDLENCIKQWSKWLAEGISLEQISDLRVRDIVEANSCLIKMLQGEDGGIMCTPRFYTTSYIRDTHSALRGMLAAGHSAEARGYLLWVHNKYKLLKSQGKFPIPNAANIGCDGQFPGFGDEANWSSETPALYMLIAENYFKATGDMETLKSIDESLRFSMKCQLDCARTNGWKLPFNRDETESGGAGIKLWDLPGKWSMPSLLLCEASLDFFIRYLEQRGENEKIARHKEMLKSIRGSLYSNFWNAETGMYDWYRGEHGERPRFPISNFLFMPVYFHSLGNNPRLAIQCAKKMKQHVNERGFIPNQPGMPHGDFCGHNPGYLLWALADMNDPLKDRIFDALIFGGPVGCWGNWSESYTSDGLSYGPKGGQQYWDAHSPVHNLRAFECGTNLEALIKYLNLTQDQRQGRINRTPSQRIKH